MSRKHACAVWTAHSSYPGPDRLLITSEGGPIGIVFAPPVGWEPNGRADALEYVQAMRESYRANRAQWDMVLASNRVVLVCSCLGFCHRSILARILGKCGARIYGEITEWDLTEVT